ncbi:MAG: 3-oxoacyl-ACP reductase [Candidatus Cloacimonadota bacterium]|nr:MAG: 3-oxoacyl-ACP reductase [Candidatus Cloacimonadota bacterium]
MYDFFGKTAIITGSAQGIGKAIAKKFSECNCNLVLIDVNKEKLDLTVKELSHEKIKIKAYKVDITDESKLDIVVNDIKTQLPSIDILVNNAGVTRDALLLRMSEQDWDDVMNVNLKGTFLCTKKFAKIMIKQRSGKIINIASIIGQIGNAGQANYAASKAGIIAFTKSIAKELASRNINVNAVAPGFIKTEMTDRLPTEIVERYKAKIPLNRFGNPEDVAEIVLFLASEQANYITGETINADGGLVMR